MEKRKLKITDSLPIRHRNSEKIKKKKKTMSKKIRMYAAPELTNVKSNIKSKEKLIKRLKQYLEEFAKFHPDNKFLLGIFERDSINQNMVNTAFFSSENIDNIRKSFEKKMFESSKENCKFVKSVY